VPSALPRSQRQALADLAAAMSVPQVPVIGIPWSLLQAIGLAVPFMREFVAVRHQFDQEYVIDATATTDVFGLRATPWAEVVAATTSVLPVRH
jgi:hypothetical protein